MPEIIENLLSQSYNNLKEPRKVLSVSEVTQDIKLILENTFVDIWVEGEVSGFTKTQKGIIFFSLKDNAALLRCVMFNSFANSVKFEIKDGMQLICFGRIGVYEKDGRYQLYIRQVEPKGIGGLQLALEQLKERLAQEGLFRQEHKKQIPYLPSKIGIVTSLTGAAIKDILKVLDRRFGDIRIIIKHVRVQGAQAKTEIAQAIKDFNRFNEQVSPAERIEVMIVGRGGGSIEDLWAFNEEVVARAVYNSRIPVISAVGHERDCCVTDLVADLRAPTPSVAAELVVPKKEDLRSRIDDLCFTIKRFYTDIESNFKEKIHNYTHRLLLGMEHAIKLNTTEFESAKKKLGLLNPVLLIQQHNLRLGDLVKQINAYGSHFIKLKQSEFGGLLRKLISLSPLNILSRGYSITFKVPQGTLVKSSKLIKKGDIVKTKLHDGEIVSQITEVK